MEITNNNQASPTQASNGLSDPQMNKAPLTLFGHSFSIGGALAAGFIVAVIGGSIGYIWGKHNQEDRYRDQIDDFKQRITNLERDSKSK